MKKAVNETYLLPVVRRCVQKSYGEEKWLDIEEILKTKTNQGCSRIECPKDRIINDEVLSQCYKLFDKRSFIRLLGKHYIYHLFDLGYERILRRIAPDFLTFVNTLDSLHQHFSHHTTSLKLPTFRVIYKNENNDEFQSSLKEESFKTKSGEFYIEYAYEKEEFEEMAMGALETAAKIFYNEDITMMVCSKNILKKTTIFVVRCDKDVGSIEQKFDFPFNLNMNENLESVIDNKTFINIFPFHLLLNRDLTITQAGLSLQRIISRLYPGITRFKDAFAILSPEIELSFDNILSRINSIFFVVTQAITINSDQSKNKVEKRRSNNFDVSRSISVEENLAIKNDGIDELSDDDDNRNEDDDDDDSIPSLRLRGQMMYLTESDTIIFFPSPCIQTLDGLSEKGMYLSDIPIYDTTRDLILLSKQHTAENELKKKLKTLNNNLESTCAELEYEQKLADKLLYRILPPTVADDLRAKRPVLAKKYDIATIMFCGITDFSNLFNDINEPMKIVDILNVVYTEFDQLTDRNAQVYKVESIGDKYMCVSGLPELSPRHAYNITKLAVDMKEIVEETIIEGVRVTVTIGIHSGEVVAGVIGQKLPRYCLFGNTVNLASRTETTGVKERINLTATTYRALQNDKLSHFEFEYRGCITMKGKREPMECYLIVTHLP